MTCSTPRRWGLWLALSAIYLVLLVLLGLLYGFDREAVTEDKILGVLGVAVLPALAFAAVAVPLWQTRDVHQRSTKRHNDQSKAL
jgi:hypothetical protein